MALTEKQRHSIIERDWGTSQLLHYNEKEGWYKGGYCAERGGDCTDLHAHHIDPQRNGGGDTELNIILLYACEHVGICKQARLISELAIPVADRKPNKYVDPEKAFVVHPDITEAFMNYNGTEDPFKAVFAARQAALDRGEVYWNTDHDEQFRQTARERSMDAEIIAAGWTFHERKKKH